MAKKTSSILVLGILASSLALAPAAHARETSKCAVSQTVPAKVSVSKRQQTLTIKLGSTPGCIGELGFALTRVSDGRQLATGSVRNDSEAYLKGSYTVTLPTQVNHQIAGKYNLRTVGHLESGWARSNGLNMPWNPGDFAKITNSNTVDVRYASKVSVAAAREFAGIRLSGKIERFTLSNKSGSGDNYVPVHDGLVELQEKVNGAWIKKATVRSDSKGAFVKVLDRNSGGEFRAVAVESKQYWTAHSSSAKVANATVKQAKLALGTKWDSKTRNHTVAVKASALSGAQYEPAVGTTAVLQRLSNGKWVNAAVRTVNKQGKASVGVKKAGTYRWVIKASKKVNLTVSKSFKLP